MTARARLLVAIGAYVCLATHLAGMLHILVVRHATCPDHGEVVHGPAPAVVEVALPPGPSARNATREPAEESDEHCLMVATRRRDMAALAPGHQVVAQAPATATLDAPATIAAAPPRALLRVAPKTSPPAAA